MHLSSVPGRIALLAATVALTVPLISPSTAFAQVDEATGAANVAVARLSLISGSVAVQRGDTTEPTAAVVNAPILAGDYVTTGDDSRAEIEIDGGTIVRLGDGVQMRFTHLENDARSIQLAEGTIELRLLSGTDGASSVDTPSISVQPRGTGSYRISVTTDGQTLVTVRAGEADVVGPQGAQPLARGTTLVAKGPSSDPAIVSQAELPPDAFDQFNAERDAGYEQAVAQVQNVPNVDTDVTGVGDLDAYGRWVSDPTYGQVWTPSNVAADWAPYRDGSWTWEGTVGWTWIGAEPWGWAPYHYGSWFRSPVYGWCWFPPRRGPVAVWRPAVVGFVSFGGGGSYGGLSYAGPGFGINIGWVPLAPYEAWHPWGGSRWGAGVNNVYINNATFVHTYRNALYGVTAVPGQRFTEGNFRHPMVVAPGELRSVQAIRGGLPFAPTAANLRFSDAHVDARLAVHSNFAEHGFAGSTEPVRRSGFAAGAPENGAIRGNFRESNGTVVNHPSSDAWGRFGQNRGIDAARSNGPTTSAYGTGRYNGVAGYQSRSYATPRTYEAPGRTNDAPSRGYAPARDYTPSRNTYAPARSYAAPQRSYGAPQRSYSAPSRSYAPTRSYSAPARSYSAPSHGSGRAPRATEHDRSR